jgi:hypothetical protein
MSASGRLAGLSLAVVTSLAISQAADAGGCQWRLGPFNSNYSAEAAAQKARSMGYDTSGIWGEGGIISDWSNRRYFFNVFFPC